MWFVNVFKSIWVGGLYGCRDIQNELYFYYLVLHSETKKQKININYFLFKLVWHENPWNIREDWMNFMKHWNFISLILTSTCLVGYKRHIPVGRFYCIVAKWYSTSQNMSKGIISLNCDSKAEKEGMYN